MLFRAAVSFSFAHEGGRPAVVAGRFFVFEAPVFIGLKCFFTGG